VTCGLKAIVSWLTLWSCGEKTSAILYCTHAYIYKIWAITYIFYNATEARFGLSNKQKMIMTLTLFFSVIRAWRRNKALEFSAEFGMSEMHHASLNFYEFHLHPWTLKKMIMSFNISSGSIKVWRPWIHTSIEPLEMLKDLNDHIESSWAAQMRMQKNGDPWGISLSRHTQIVTSISFVCHLLLCSDMLLLSMSLQPLVIT
jgi:hypothetical protein